MNPDFETGTIRDSIAARLVHVKYSDSGRRVQPDDRTGPISEHWSETAAERAAIEHAAGREDCDVVVHDRYTAGSLRQPPARETAIPARRASFRIRRPLTVSAESAASLARRG